jgi:hypothetical protein
MKKKAKFVVYAVAALFVAIGSIDFLAGALIGNVVKTPDGFELPLGDLKGIAVDSDGNIYCGTQYYSRVQVYDSEGHYIRGKFVDSAGGAFRIRINPNNELEVATARNDKLYRFGKDGTLVTELSDVGYYFSEFGKSGETQYYDEKQNVTYQIRWSLLGAYVVKKSASGERKVIVKTPFHKWLFQGPNPAWFFLMVGILMFACTEKHFLNHLLGLDRIDKDKHIFWKIKRALEK